ncbi:trace amine-associated receptor 1-like [Polypterus senegalus]|uniref:trace amine-associated receptor 1-like n=1 Tax=Polypterus senegalus TaxID=55291 RepID=UPI001965C30F|nr:trace amine-associated receptor 1-like [Polypterus senegalus]
MNFNESDSLQSIHFCYESLNNSCQKHVLSSHTYAIVYTVMWAIIIITVCGNLIVIISISHFIQLHSPTNFLVFSLAVTDLLLGGFVMPPIAVQLIETCWYLGEAFYRYYAVCHPLTYKSKITMSLTIYLILFCWILSVAVGFLIVYLELNLIGVEDLYYEKSKCVGSCLLLQNEASGLVSSLFSFYIPGFIMIVIYIKIFSVAQRQARSIQDAAQFNQTAEQKRNVASRKRETKAAKTLATVVGVFLLCWSPFFLCNIIDPLINFSTPPLLIDIFAWFGYMNSTFNPLIYGFFYSWFRKALRLIVYGKIFQSDSSRMKLFSD